MSNEIAMNALVAKRTDILFEIREAEKRIERLQTELAHLDAVLRMFRPDFKAEGLPVRHRRPTKSPYFRHGELTQRIFDALRERGEIASADVAVIAMRNKRLDPDNDSVPALTSCAGWGCNSTIWPGRVRWSGLGKVGRCGGS